MVIFCPLLTLPINFWNESLLNTFRLVTKGSTIQSVFAHAMKKDMRELIKKYEADMVICTEKDFVKLKDIYEIPKLHVLAIEFNILEDNICWKF
mgnify:CR=1 FL=1